MGGTYEPINQASDVTNLSADMTQPAWASLFNAAQSFLSGQGVGEQFGTLASQLQDLVYGGPGAESMYGYAQTQADKIRQQLAQQYSGSNALFSGAFGQALGEGVSAPFQQAAAGLNQQLGSLYGQGLGGIFGLGQSAISGMTQMAMPTYWQPDYAYQPGPFDYLAGIVGLGGDIAQTAVSAYTGVPS